MKTYCVKCDQYHEGPIDDQCKSSGSSDCYPTLLVGGTNDGKRMVFSDGMLNVRLLKVVEPVAVGDYPLEASKIEEYRKELFAGCSKTFEIFVSTEIDADEVIRRLIEGYKVG